MRHLPLPLLAALLLACPTADEAPPPPPDYDPVRFVALGDTGEGNDDQYLVADVMQTVCADQGCDFALLLGDNIYNTGVDALDDVQWQDKFELPYADLDLTFYAVLGNHDYGNLATDAATAHWQVLYSDVSDKWLMPHEFYEHSHSNVDFYGLDTNATMFPQTLADTIAAQEAWVAERFPLDAPDDRWRIAYGHHPYLSNGTHGNAGNYDGFEPPATISGEPIKELFDTYLCGDVDLYLCGHDHDRQWHEQTCDGTQFIVSGAGAKLRPFEDDQPVHYADDQDEGFVWIEIDDQTITVQFWDRWGEMNYEGGWTRER